MELYEVRVAANAQTRKRGDRQLLLNRGIVGLWAAPGAVSTTTPSTGVIGFTQDRSPRIRCAGYPHQRHLPRADLDADGRSDLVAAGQGRDKLAENGDLEQGGEDYRGWSSDQQGSRGACESDRRLERTGRCVCRFALFLNCLGGPRGSPHVTVDLAAQKCP